MPVDERSWRGYGEVHRRSNLGHVHSIRIPQGKRDLWGWSEGGYQTTRQQAERCDAGQCADRLNENRTPLSVLRLAHLRHSAIIAYSISATGHQAPDPLRLKRDNAPISMTERDKGTAFQRWLCQSPS